METINGQYTLKQASEAFAECLERIIKGEAKKDDLNMSISTAKAYRTRLKDFLDSKTYLNMQTALYEGLESKVFEHGYLAYVSGHAKIKQSIGMLKALNKNAQETNACIQKLSPPKKEVASVTPEQFLSKFELEALQKSPLSKYGIFDKEGATSLTQVRNRALLTVIEASLATNDDLRSMSFKDYKVVDGSGYLTIRGKKVGKHIQTWEVKFTHNQHKRMMAYIDYVKENIIAEPHHQHLFFNPQRTGQALSRASISKHISKCVREICGHKKEAHDQQTGTSIQCIRVSWARLSYGKGVDKNIIQEKLGITGAVNKLHESLHIDPRIEHTRNESLERKEAEKVSVMMG